MNTMTSQMFSAILMTIVMAAACSAALQEVCQWQTFQASCKKDEVILMKTARYGRMRIGKCLTRNYFVGCSADVSEYMHARCSGRRHCSVSVPDQVMFTAQPCPKDLMAYLEADYECVKVSAFDAADCTDGSHVLTAPRGLISKPQSHPEHGQKHVCPRRIVAKPGQTINIYLSDFYSKHNNMNEATSEHLNVMAKPVCITYGLVSEDGTTTPTRICGGEFKKNQLIYTSNSNVVDITLTAPSAHAHHYLLQYEVVGCPTLEVSENSWVQVIRDTAVVHCNNSKTAFHLTCVNNEWVGDLQNCTDNGPVAHLMSGSPFSSLFVNTGLFLAVSIGVALGVLLGIGLLTLAIVLCSARRNRSKMMDQVVAEQGQSSLLKKPAAFLPEPIVDATTNYHYLPVDHYQAVAVDNSEYGTKTIMPLAPVHHLFEAAHPGDLSTLRSSRVLSTFGNTLDARMPATENTYGPLGGERPLCLTEVNAQTTLPACGHDIYDLAALSHQAREKIITLDQVVIN